MFLFDRDHYHPSFFVWPYLLQWLCRFTREYCCPTYVYQGDIWRFQLKSADSFPLDCVNERCNGVFILCDVERILAYSIGEDRKALIKLLGEKSLAHFLKTNDFGYKRCRAENCGYILTVSSKFGPIQSLCLSREGTCFMLSFAYFAAGIYYGQYEKKTHDSRES